MKRITITLALSTMVLGSMACGSDNPGPLDGVEEITFLQRVRRQAGGDIFQYTSYVPGARLVKLSPPTADGTLTELCCARFGPEYAEADISGYDISFDAREIVMAMRLSSDQRYGLFVLSLDNDSIEQLATDPNKDYVQPIFLPGDKIMFTTNAVAEEGAQQHRDEYERRTTTQLGVVNTDGSNMVLGARNLSHRLHPALLSSGRVMLTQWDHLGGDNAGRLLTANPDMSLVREAFGKEGRGVTNSYTKAVEISPGRVLAIGSSRNGTLQSGTILDIRLGEVREADGIVRADSKMAERNSSYQILTAQVPLGGGASAPTIGRYYDAYPLDAGNYPSLLVSWADGPVSADVLEAAGVSADFGIYLYDSKNGTRKPIWNDDTMWDLFPRPLAPRTAPPKIDAAGKHEYAQDSVLIGSLNIYESTVANFAPGEVYAVQIIEGFSSEEGIPRNFGSTQHEGAALLGVAPVSEDGSWAALIPSSVPVHIQVIDKFGMNLKSEPVWISGNPGESLFCGGCHEDRAATTVVQPGIPQALLAGPVNMLADKKRSERVSLDFSIGNAVGIPWDQALQPLFDAKCISCHEGTPGPANPGFTIMDPETGLSQTITFDLRGQTVEYGTGDDIVSGYTASYLSLMGPDMLDLENAGLEIVGEMPIYVEPVNSRGSSLLTKLNPYQLYPTVDTNARAFTTTPHGAEQGFSLTPSELSLLIRMADFGGQFFSRENAPGLNY